MVDVVRGSLVAVLLIALVSGCGERESAGGADTSSVEGAPAKPASGYTVIDVANGGSITGHVALRAGSTPPGEFQTPATQDVCSGGAVTNNNRLMPGPDGSIPWAIVRIRDIGSGKGFATGAAGGIILDQKQCQYLPHLVAVPVGGVIPIRNLDPVPHNIRIEDPASDSILMNLVQATAGRVDSFTVDRPGAVIVRCDYHPWMNAYLFGVDNPYYAVTGPDGTFTIDGIPPGSYTVELWFNGPRILPKRTPNGTILGYGFSDPIIDQRPVTIAAGGRQELQFEISP